MMRKRTGVLAAVFLTAAISMSACGNGGTAATEATTTAGVTEKVAETTLAAETAGQTRIITDSAGREVEIPVEVNKIAPSGPLAQIVLYTVSPDKLAGLASDFTEEARLYIDEAYWGLPKFGQFYGKNASLNMEALIAEAPDVIIDIGEPKKTVREDMDALQKQLGIPVIFVEATLPTMEQAYQMLGEITGEQEQAEKLAAYCREILSDTETTAAAIPDGERRSVYFASGESGLNTNARGSIHADVIDWIGAVNAADVEAVSSGGGSGVSMEQILLWQPDLIIVDSEVLYETVTTDSVWKDVKAVQEGHVYKIPSVPYSFMNSPPSVNRMIGIQWLGNLVYPEQYPVDIKQEVKEFYELFYHSSITEEQMTEILKHALAQ